MKELTSYITEKLDINNISLSWEIPIESTYDKFVKYLNDNKFKEIKYDNSKHGLRINLVKAFNDEHKRVFMSIRIDNGSYQLYFANTENEKISSSNLCYEIKYKNNSPYQYATITPFYFQKIVNYDVVDIKEFIKELNMNF